MNDEGSPGSPDVTLRRDRLLAALLAAEPGLLLMRWDADVAVLLGTTEVRRILVLTVPEGTPGERLAKAFAAQVKTVAQGSPPTHLVVMGGGPETAAALKRSAPYVQPVPMGFHHVDARGILTHVTGRRLPLLERVWAGLDHQAPVDRARIADALTQGQALATQERAVVSRLHGRFGVTAAITVVCVVLSALSYLWGAGAHDAALWRMGANRGAALHQGEVWRLFASAFLHANGVHLAVNMVALWSFGPMLEAILGSRRYVLLYGASALGGALASGLLGGDHWSVGASGAIWGLMAAGIGLAMRPKGLLPPLMARQMKARSWMPLLVNLGYSLQPGIDLRAHLGGGFVGFALMATVLTEGLKPLEQRATVADVERRPGPFMSVAAALVATAMAVSVVAALVAGRPWEVGAAPVLRRTAVGDTGLTLDLPSAIADEVIVEAGKTTSARIFTFGHPNDTPVMFEIIVFDLGAEVPAAGLDAFMDAQRKGLEEHAPPKAVRKGPARRLMLGDRPAVVVEHELNGFHLQTYLEIIGTLQVLVRGYSQKERPASWQGLEEKVAATLAAK